MFRLVDIHFTAELPIKKKNQVIYSNTSVNLHAIYSNKSMFIAYVKNVITCNYSLENFALTKTFLYNSSKQIHCL